MLEQFRGGMNAAVHLSLPDEILVDIEEHKQECGDCGRKYYPKLIHNEEHRVHIEPFVPKDGHCFDCGSSKIQDASDPRKFE